jgi:hypothetical protein
MASACRYYRIGMPLVLTLVAFKKSYGKPNENIALPAGRVFLCPFVCSLDLCPYRPFLINYGKNEINPAFISSSVINSNAFPFFL